MKPSQIIVNDFMRKHNVKLSPSEYKRSLGQANQLLKTYSKEDILTVIEYTSKNVKSRIFSIGYFKFIMEETLKKALLEKVKELQSKNIEPVVEEKEIVNNKFKKKRLMSYGEF